MTRADAEITPDEEAFVRAFVDKHRQERLLFELRNEIEEVTEAPKNRRSTLRLPEELRIPLTLLRNDERENKCLFVAVQDASTT